MNGLKWLAVAAVVAAAGAGITYVLKLERDNVLQGVTDTNNRLGNTSDDARSRFDNCPRELWDGPNLRCRRKP